jgi:hypothetical protein
MSELIKREDVRRELQASFDGGAFRWQDGQDLMDRINALPTASPWHRVEEQLPNVGELVVGLDADGHAEITMLSESKCWLTYGLWIHNLGCYVWWMSLPEPPKEDA